MLPTTMPNKITVLTYAIISDLNIMMYPKKFVMDEYCLLTDTRLLSIQSLVNPEAG